MCANKLKELWAKYSRKKNSIKQFFFFYVLYTFMREAPAEMGCDLKDS